jgi:hypothetical protein
MCVVVAAYLYCTCLPVSCWLALCHMSPVCNLALMQMLLLLLPRPHSPQTLPLMLLIIVSALCVCVPPCSVPS